MYNISDTICSVRKEMDYVSGKAKLNDRIMNGTIPKDIRYAEVHNFLTSNNFVLKPGNGSSHRIYIHEDCKEQLSIPAHDDGSIIKRGYIQNIRERINEIESKDN
jgi:predicted RNA binding protein YcfA (HicA-like mRNA interferase family)